MRTEVVHDHDIAGLQGWQQRLLDPSEEPLAIDRTIEDIRGGHPIMPEGCDEGHCQPMPSRGLGEQRLPLAAPAMGRCHIGLGPGLINEDKALRHRSFLILLPLLAPVGNLRPVLFAGEYGFF